MIHSVSENNNIGIFSIPIVNLAGLKHLENRGKTYRVLSSRRHAPKKWDRRNNIGKIYINYHVYLPPPTAPKYPKK